MPPVPARTRGARRIRRQASPEARRAQILKAALRCIATHGYHAATMDEIAREAKLSKGSLYWYFESKEEVLEVLFRAFALELFQAWQAEAAQHRGSVVELLGRVGELSLERMVANEPLLRAWAEFLVHPETRALLAEIYRVSRRTLAGWVRGGIASKELRRLSPEGVAATATATIEGLLLQTLVDPDFDPRPHWRTAWAIFARGVSA